MCWREGGCTTCIPLVRDMILAYGVLVLWFHFLVLHDSFVNCPVGSKNVNLSSHTQLCGFLKKRKPHGSDWRLFGPLWRHHFHHPTTSFWTLKAPVSWVELSTTCDKYSTQLMTRSVVLKLNSNQSREVLEEESMCRTLPQLGITCIPFLHSTECVRGFWILQF